MNPASLVKLFSAHLGWKGLQQENILLTVEEFPLVKNTPVLVTYWLTPNQNFRIQINQREHAVFGKYEVTVAAHRYHIISTRFVSADFSTEEQAIAEAARLSPKLHRKNFRNPAWQKDFLLKNPMRIYSRERRGWMGRLAKASREELRRTGKSRWDYPTVW